MMDLLVQGGWVMFVILALSVLALAIAVERCMLFFRIREPGAAIVASVESSLKAGNAELAGESIGRGRGPVSAVVAASLREWEAGSRRMEEAAEFEGQQVAERLEVGLRPLSMIAQASPLLGLLGTVLGMIRTFMAIQGHGGEVEVSVLAEGIWEALLTTAFGLMVAIPTLLAHHYFDGLVGRHVRRMELAGERLASLRRSVEGRP